MRPTRKLFFLLTCVALISTAALLAADKNKSKKAATAVPQMDDDKRILHALNRLTFGPRPGDVDKVRAIGLSKWFEEQLHPDKIEDSSTEARLSPLRTLKMSTSDMVENFPPPQVLKMVENGRMSMPHDEAKRAIYESRIAAYEQKQQADKQQQKEDANPDMKTDNAGQGDDQMTPEQKQRRQKKLEAQMYADVDAVQLLDMPPDQRYKNILKMSPQERLALGRSLKGGQGMQLTEGMTPQQRETIQAIVNPQAVVGGELAQAKLLRAVYSERQLDEVMTDFWYNHFNVFIGKGPDRYMITAYERDVIRPHALGKFKDLLVATAKSPAMLFYLDNWQSVGPNSDLAKNGPQRRRQGFQRGGFGGGFGRPRFPNANQGNGNQGNGNGQQQAQKNRPSGLNENYAREIMELHTLGVDGGYTQKDVTELAKVLTGWSIQQPHRGGDFFYNDRAHEPGKKNVLGHEIKDKGESEGMEMLDILAHHPATAKFVSKKLAMRFVSDNPPQSLIDQMAQTFLEKDGDIREVLRTMFRSPEFWAADAYRAKVKTPLEFVASAVRASSVDIQNALPLVQQLNRMGMPLYGMQPPTGYSMKAETWVNSSALVNRMNFALQLGNGRLAGITPDPKAILQGATPQDTNSALSMMEQKILGGDLSSQTHAVIQKQLADPQVTQRKLDDADSGPNYGAIAGLIMGSPEFQRR
ncbi:MAG TPA: DUF1800 domain-containing protein [Candidatus Angelobacter sp.]|jgi:uncharacterized protein (DUF1800 family)|nr:DUF1800 domain-containing protein [Candidatus Angelobacter sp.]